MKHRYVLGKIRQEAQTVMEDNNVFLHFDTVDSAIFSPASMPYTMAVFYEVLRLFPTIPFQIKQCEQAATLPDGTFLPEKSVVLWSLWSMNRSKLTWGNDAETFKPDRWLANGRLVTKSTAEFPVFNGGPRTCLGKKMAESVAVQVIAVVASMFDFMPADEQERVSKNSLTLPMDGGLPCLVKRRSLGAR
jgi:cytochrome P450